MKLYQWLLLITAATISCDGPQKTSTKPFIPGVYARTVQNEFSKGRDTLIIRNVANDQYSIDHLLTYQRITNGKTGAVENKKEGWTALYDEKSGSLVEQKRGRVLSFQPEKKTLTVGSSVYEKLQ